MAMFYNLLSLLCYKISREKSKILSIDVITGL